MTITQSNVFTRYHYDFNQLDRVPEGVLSAKVTPRRFLSGETAATGKSLSIGAVVAGQSLQVSLVQNARGTGSKLHTHPNEQFNYVLEGTLIADIDARVFRVPVGHLIHIPAGMVHSHVSSPEGDVLFFAAKDTRHGIVGPPVDGKHDGPRTLPGFGENRSNEWKLGPQGLPEAQSPAVTNSSVSYVYDTQTSNTLPSGLSSGRITPRTDLEDILVEPATSISGEKLQVGIIRLAQLSTEHWRSCPREQFITVLGGTVGAKIDDQSIILQRHCGLHIPAGMPYAISALADDGALCILVEGAV